MKRLESSMERIMLSKETKKERERTIRLRIEKPGTGRLIIASKNLFFIRRIDAQNEKVFFP